MDDKLSLGWHLIQPHQRHAHIALKTDNPAKGPFRLDLRDIKDGVGAEGLKVEHVGFQFESLEEAGRVGMEARRGLVGLVDLNGKYSFADDAAMNGAGHKLLSQVASLVQIDYKHQ